MIDPNKFIITRKRKLYKFAKFANAENCFELADWKKQSIDVLEIGAGTGLFSLELAARNPDKKFVALDVKADRLQRGAYFALERNINNVYFVRARADQLLEIVPKNSLHTVWLTFPDPFASKSSSGRRLTHPNFLKLYSEALAKTGSLKLKHDNPDFFQWSLEKLVENHWSIDELSFDLHQSQLPDDYKIITSYEQRWLDEGRLTRYLDASKNTQQKLAATSSNN